VLLVMLARTAGPALGDCAEGDLACGMQTVDPDDVKTGVPAWTQRALSARANAVVLLVGERAVTYRAGATRMTGAGASLAAAPPVGIFFALRPHACLRTRRRRGLEPAIA